jgi:hypothetical protein
MQEKRDVLKFKLNGEIVPQAIEEFRNLKILK